MAKTERQRKWDGSSVKENDLRKDKAESRKPKMKPFTKKERI